MRNIALPYREEEREAFLLADKKLKSVGLKGENFSVYKRSVDARKKENIRFVYSIVADLLKIPEKRRLEKIDGTVLLPSPKTPECGNEELGGQVIVVGFGPCGMFAALTLAEAGYRPLVLERGEDIEFRHQKVNEFFETGTLLEDCNVQFGAGGAGTFSDGKLVTRINDPLGSAVLERLADFGAPESILTLAKPHIGTDRLKRVVVGFEKRIEELGGRILFGTKMTGFSADASGTITSVHTNRGEFSCGALILAIGHSARDTYKMLHEKTDCLLVPKDFSVGARIEHLQRDLDRSLYGDADISLLGHGEYTLSYREGERGVYSFCMCPGGKVICASSEKGGLVVNGMSDYLRDGRNANSAIAVSVLKKDYGDDPMKAIAFQEELERKAFSAAGGGYKAPIQTVGDFLNGKKGTEPKRILPTFRNGTNCTPSDLHTVLPGFVTELLETGLRKFASRISCFKDSDALLTGVETRTSAPLRILRSEEYTALGYPNLYPCGEGAGYAGGITSAGIDGIRTAYKIIGRYRPSTK